MNSKTALYVGGVALLVVFASFSFSKFTEALTPYVSYDEAIATPRSVQVAGGLEAGSSSYDSDNGYLRFTLVDLEKDAKTLKVRYDGIKPANFEEAISIVAIGKWDTSTDEFAAHDLLVKCPSKYQGVEGYETKTYSADESEGAYEAKTLSGAEPAASTETVGPSV